MPRSPESFDRMREASREKILSAALELFARHGFASTSVRMLSARAGVSQGLLYNYFDGKRGLLRAIFERSMEDVGETLAEAEQAPAADALAVLTRAAFDAVRRNREFWMLTYRIRLQPEVLRDLGEDVAGWAEAVRGRIEELLVRAGAVEPALHARLLFAAIDGVAQHYALEPSTYPLDAVAGEVVRLLVPAPRAPRETR